MPTEVKKHTLELTHEELRDLVVAVDHAVNPDPRGGQLAFGIDDRLTVLHERLWEELRK